jgi:hypothetical protein
VIEKTLKQGLAESEFEDRLIHAASLGMWFKLLETVRKAKLLQKRRQINPLFILIEEDYAGSLAENESFREFAAECKWDEDKSQCVR